MRFKTVENHEETLDKVLKEEILKYISNRMIYDSINNLISYSLEFSNVNKFNEKVVKDTLVYISTLNCYEKTDGYRGVIKEDGFTIAIFDIKRLGVNYYDTTKISGIPICNLKCQNEKIIPIKVYIIKNKIIVERMR